MNRYMELREYLLKFIIDILAILSLSVNKNTDLLKDNV